MKRKSIALFLAAALCFSVAGCASKPAQPAQGTETAGGNQAEQPAPEAQSDQSSSQSPDNDLVVAFNNDLQSLDPHNTTDTLSITVSRTMYEGLISFDDNQNIIPVLAESYEASDDNLTYTFKLRQGVKFHDGTDFNAAAFIANYERVMANESFRQYRRASTWESVTAPDDYTIVIVTNKPNSSFINQFTQFLVISPKAIAELGNEGLAKTTVGTGPYTFGERIEGDRITVNPFDGYWGEKPSVDSLTFRAVPEDGSRVAMLQTGEADFIYPLPAIQAPNVDGTKDIKVVASPSNIMRYVTLNNDKKELSDKRVRQAMNYAIDKNAYAKTIFNGYASEVNSCFPSTVSYYSPQTPYTYDLEKAKQLMTEAGYPDGFDVTIWGDNTTNEEKGMQFVQQQLSQIGINVNIVPMEPNIIDSLIYVEKAQATIEMWYVNWSASSFDADGSMRSILYSQMAPPTSANTAYYNNPEFDRLLDEGLATSDPEQLKTIYADAQKIAWDDAPWLFLGNDQVIAGTKTYLSGVSLRPDGSLNLKSAALN